jgi:hypothetical protein
MKELEQVKNFIQMRSQGVSYAKISKKMRISKQTLINWGKDFEHFIQNDYAAEMEVLCERYKIQKKHKIRLYGETLKSIKKELKKRNFAEIPTEKLMELMVKYTELLEKEIPESDFLTSYKIIKKGVASKREDPIYSPDEERPRFCRHDTSAPPAPAEQPQVESSSPPAPVFSKPELDRFFTEMNLPPIPLPQYNYTPTPS